MTPKFLMLVGGLSSVPLLIIEATRPESGVCVALFGCAALFGKGYGIWEERTRARPESTVQE